MARSATLLVLAEGARLLQQPVDQGGLAVVDVGDDGDVARFSGGGAVVWVLTKPSRAKWPAVRGTPVGAGRVHCVGQVRTGRKQWRFGPWRGAQWAWLPARFPFRKSDFSRYFATRYQQHDAAERDQEANQPQSPQVATGTSCQAEENQRADPGQQENDADDHHQHGQQGGGGAGMAANAVGWRLRMAHGRRSCESAPRWLRFWPPSIAVLICSICPLR